MTSKLKASEMDGIISRQNVFGTAQGAPERKSKRIFNAILKDVAEDGGPLVGSGAVYAVNAIDGARGVLLSTKELKVILKPQIVKMRMAWYSDGLFVLMYSLQDHSKQFSLISCEAWPQKLLFQHLLLFWEVLHLLLKKGCQGHS